MDHVLSTIPSYGIQLLDKESSTILQYSSSSSSMEMGMGMGMRMMGMNHHHHRRRHHQLLDNCDLPPPRVRFSPTKEDSIREVMESSKTLLPQMQTLQCNDKLRQEQSLLRALRLSQTRAREAEKKTIEANISRDQIASILLHDSLKLHAAQQWVRLLEMEISLLKQQSQAVTYKEEEERHDGGAVSAVTWCLTVGLCLGIAGAGMLLSQHIL